MKNMKHCYDLTLEDRTLWVRAIGVWTVRDIDDYIRDFRATVNPVISGPWACVLDVRAWQTSPQDILAGTMDNTLWCVRNNLVHVVALVPKDHIIGWQFLKATSVEMPEHLVRQRAQNEDEARQLLIDAGFIKQSIRTD